MTRAQQERQATKYLDRATKALGLQHYEIKYLFRYADGDKGQAWVQSEYEQGRINVSLENAESLNDLAATCLHEVIHFVLGPLYTVATDMAKELDGKFPRRVTQRANELVTTTLTRALMPLVYPELYGAE